MDYNREFVKNLNEYMSARNVTGKILAKELNMSEAAISYYRTGKREPQLTTLCMIADFFEITLDELMGRKEY